ncbi:MAG TPA: acyltransferase [Acetobacteraceae bacterium]|jgi:predicted LPLAT superfamily acyltransferase|nr:acyltransferase [Acetobacteraceae bacterium]
MIADAWSARRERGSASLVRLMVWLTLGLGWPVGQALLYPITGYFFLFSRGARRASGGFLSRVLNRPATSREQFRHLFTFSCVLLDRLFLLSNRLRQFRIDVTGLEHVTAALAQGRGCVLLGSHLGSFEVLRAFGRRSPVPVRVLMYRANAGSYSRLVEPLDPTLRDAIIEIGTPEAMLLVRESLTRGEMVGILADRAPDGQKMVTVPFLGEPAAFPTGPLVLCAALAVPVVLFFGIHIAPRRYDVRFEAFADSIATERATRTEDIAGWIKRYVGRLEAFCREYPFNWFNFYDFWDSPPSPTLGSVAAAAPVPAVEHEGRSVAASLGGRG